jgi:hypothetical protein
MSEPLSLTTRKNLPFLRLNLQNLNELRVPVTKTQNHSSTLSPLNPFLLLLLLLRINARGKEIMMKKIPARLNSPEQLPENLLPKTNKSSTLRHDRRR